MQSSASSAPSLAEIFNPERFDQLTLGDAGLQSSLVDSFLHQVPATLAAFELAVSAEAFGECVHRLRGAAHFVAADRLAETLMVIEKLPDEGDAARKQAARRICMELVALEQVLRGPAPRLRQGSPAR